MNTEMQIELSAEELDCVAGGFSWKTLFANAVSPGPGYTNDADSHYSTNVYIVSVSSNS